PARGCPAHNGASARTATTTRDNLRFITSLLANSTSTVLRFGYLDCSVDLAQRIVIAAVKSGARACRLVQVRNSGCFRAWQNPLNMRAYPCLGLPAAGPWGWMRRPPGGAFS